MKKVISMTTAIFLLILLVSCSSGLKDNYKTIKWNATLEQIKKLEDQEIVTNDNIIYFTFYDVYGEEARVEYCFNGNTFSDINIDFLNPNEKLYEELLEKVKSEYDIAYESIYDSTMASFETKSTTIWLMTTADNIVSLSFSPLED